jgi:hypothetical protein
MLVRIVKNWSWPDLMRQTPGGSGRWGDVQFTLEPVTHCDALLVCNEVCEEISVVCPPENVWALFQEPYVQGFSAWMREGHKPFARIYTHHPPVAAPRYRNSPPWVPWHVGWSYDELVSLPKQDKADRIVWVASALQWLPGHRKRYAFYEYLTRLDWPDLEMFGRGIQPVADKREVLQGARYAIAVENSCGPDYWTEKVADCWLAESLPFYYGCLNLEDYFPAEAFVRIDLDDFARAARVIRATVEAGEYERRLPAIREARHRLLHHQQFFPFMAKELCDIRSVSAPQQIHLAPYLQGWVSRQQDRFSRRLQLLREGRLRQP